MYISEDDLGNNSQAKVQVIEGVYFDNLYVTENTIIFKFNQGKKMFDLLTVSDIFVLGMN